MESDRFDALTRSVASRRSMLTRVGGGGLGALLAGALGLRAEAAAPTKCILDVRLFVRVGPSAGLLIVPTSTKPGELTGKLRLSLSSGGDLAGSTFILSDGTSYPVTGNVSAHQIGARVTIANDLLLVLQGVGEHGVRSCQGAIDGGLIGLREGDLGDWHAIAETPASTPTATTATTAGNGQGNAPTQIPVSGPTDTPQPGAPSETPTTAPTDTDTPAPPTPTDTPVVCPECQAPSGSGGCQPIADDTPCGGGLLCCGGFCSDLSHNPNHCASCGNVCPGGCCHNSVCCFTCGAGETDCGGTCVNLSNDGNNCGACGNVCDSDSTCKVGVCKLKPVICPQGQINCGGTCFRGKICP